MYGALFFTQWTPARTDDRGTVPFRLAYSQFEIVERQPFIVIPPTRRVLNASFLDSGRMGPAPVSRRFRIGCAQTITEREEPVKTYLAGFCVLKRPDLYICPEILYKLMH